ncbi:TPA: hypothetical protein ACGUO9_004207 [Vibrio vulnificus]
MIRNAMFKANLRMFFLLVLLVFSVVWLVIELNKSLIPEYDWEAIEKMPPYPKVVFIQTTNEKGEVVIEPRTLTTKN